MSTENRASTGTDMVLSPRQEQLQRMRDEMSPGEKPQAIVPRTFAEVLVICQALAAADLAPKALRGKATDMALVIMTGAEVGLPPMASLRLYTTWDGVPRLMAEGVRAIILQSPAIEYFEMSTCSDTEATWIGKRRGRPEKSVTWTIERARKAGLLDKPVWKAYPQDLLNARASMQLGRIIAPDVVAGMVALEEARDGDFVDAQFTETKPQFVAPAPAPVTFSGPIAGVPNKPDPIQTAASEPPRRGPGRPPRVDPTTPQQSGAGPSASATSSGTSPSPSGGSTAAESTPSKLDAAIKVVEQKADPTPASPNTGPTPSGESAGASTAPRTSGVVGEDPGRDAYGAMTPVPDVSDGFGGTEDPVDRPATGPTMADFHAWIASCKTQRDLQAGLQKWRAWSQDCAKAGDTSFNKDGANTIAMQTAYAKRKAEVPA